MAKVVRNGLIVIGMVAVVAVMIFWIAWSPRLWQVWVFPSVSFLILQGIALKYSDRGTFFKLADYVHYGLIGSAVGVASLYVLNGGLVDRLSLLIERQVLTQERASIDSTGLVLKSSLSESRATPPLSKELSAKCGSDEYYAWLIENSRVSSSQGTVIGYALPNKQCLAAYQTRAKIASIESELQQASERRTAIEERLKALDQELLPGNSSPTDDPSLDELQVRFIMIPTLILLGVSIKLGKTTQALIP